MTDLLGYTGSVLATLVVVALLFVASGLLIRILVGWRQRLRRNHQIIAARRSAPGRRTSRY